MEAAENTRKKRLDLLLRANAGRKSIPDVRDILGEVLGTTIDFLPLERSDEIRSRLDEESLRPAGVQDQMLLSFSREKVRGLSLVPPQEESLFLILPEADRIGIAEIPADTLNRCWLPLLYALPDGFRMATTGISAGAVLQIAEDPPRCQEMVEISVFGREWVDFVARQYLWHGAPAREPSE